MPEPEFDVFLSHATADKPVVMELASVLRDNYGIKPWLDDWYVVPGKPSQEAIEDALKRCAACAVFIGPSATGPWQNVEMRVAIQRQINDGSYRVIPVLLPNAERGERSRLPTLLALEAWVEFHGTLEDEHALRHLAAGIRGIAPGPDLDTAEVVETEKGMQAVAGDVCPYRGLQPFEIDNSAFFHGREVLIGWLLDKLKPARVDLRFLAITGASGSGKSSLARAGLLAALKNGELPGSKDWPIAICTPGHQPLDSLALALGDALPLGSSQAVTLSLMRELAGDPRTLHRTCRIALRSAPASRRLVVLVDQFEEVFTLCTDEVQRQALIANLLYAAKEADGQTAVVLTLRSDFYGHCDAYPELASAVSDRNELVGPMTEAELRSAIVEPARTAGLELEGDLADRLLEDVEEQPGRLPLLQHALLQLWQQREGHKLTAAAYRRIGKVAGALQQHAEDIFTSFTEGEREACQRVLLRLVQADETRVTRRRLAFDELVSAADSEADRQAATTVITRLIAERLLTAGEENRPTVELAHEALINAWKRFHDWIDADRDSLRMRRRLDEGANEWVAGGRDPSYLYTGSRLSQAEEWARDRAGEATPQIREFLAASAAQRDQELEKKRRQRRRTILLLASAAVAAALAAVVTFTYWKRSERQQQINLATQMAGQSRIALASNPLMGLLLATEAVHLKSDLPEANGALLGALALSDAQPLGRTGIVAITASADRGSLATASQDGTVTVWNLAAGPPKKPERTLHVAGTIKGLALSNDRRRLLVRDWNGGVRLLDLLKGDQGTVLPKEDWRYGDPFSPDSSQLMMDGFGTPVLHDLLTNTAREMPHGSSPNPWNLDVDAKALRMAPPGARFAVLSSDGRWLAWSEDSGTVRLREEPAFPGLPAIELPGQGLPIRFLLFAQGDRWLVTQGGTEAPRLWDVSRYPYGGILAATPDGSRLAVGLPPAVRVEDPGGAHFVLLQGVEPGTSIWAFS
ncbi:MAG: TIR domain-containing protein, partial [Thermoanaerobaculia bacterium]